jgi:hypothetical protein
VGDTGTTAGPRPPGRPQLGQGGWTRGSSDDSKYLGRIPTARRNPPQAVPATKPTDDRGFKSISSPFGDAAVGQQPNRVARSTRSTRLTQGSSNALKMRSAVGRLPGLRILEPRSRMYSHRRTTQIRTGRKPPWCPAQRPQALWGKGRHGKAPLDRPRNPRLRAARLAP